MEAPYVDAVVVAAGRSSRMGGLDKLDAVIGGRTVARAWAVEAMTRRWAVERTIIVVPPERLD